MNRNRTVAAVLAAVACLGLMLAFVVCSEPSPVQTQPAQAEHPWTVAEKIEQLPEDGEWYTASLFVHRDWTDRPEESNLMARWQELPTTIGVQSPTKLFAYDEDDAIYKERFIRDCPQLPAVVIQRSDGQVVFKDHVPNLKMPTRRLHSKRPVLLPWNAECNCKPKPNTTPQPPNPNVDVVVNIPNRVVPQEQAIKEKGDGGFLAVLILACLTSAAIAGVVLFFKQIHESPN